MNKEGKGETPDEQLWYVYINNETKGPFSMRDLDVLLRTNDINSQNLAWKVGMKEWKVLNQIEEIKNSILESSKEMLQIEKKKERLFEQGPKENKEEEKPEQDANDQLIENKDQNPLTILQATVDNIIQRSFNQTEDGKWNILDEEKGVWVQEDEQPVQKIEQMKQLLFNKLKNQLFFQDKINKRKKNQEQSKEPEQELTQEQLAKREKNRKKTKRQAEKRKEKWYQPKINTFVYISGLPQDITDEELKEFVIKAGVLRIDLNTGKQKLKLYRDESGFPKGDAAVSYAKEESVQMAIQNLNDSEIRSGFKVKVEKAQFSQKQEDYKPRQLKKQSMAKKIKAKMMEKKQLSWDQNVEQEGEGLKIVILKHMIDVGRSGSDQYLENAKKDITEELSKIGEVKRIRFFETHPDGVVEVKYCLQKDAETCVYSMHEKIFDGREIECDYWDGETDFKRNASSLQLQRERLQRFAQKQKGQNLDKIEERMEEQQEEGPNCKLLGGG